MDIIKNFLTNLRQIPLVIATIMMLTFFFTQNIQVTLFAIPFILFLSVFFLVAKKAADYSLVFILSTAILFCIISLLLHGPWITLCLAMVTTTFFANFYFLKLIDFDEITALFLMILSLGVLSFFPTQISLVTILTMSAISITKLLANFNKFKSLIIDDFKCFSNLSTADSACWLLTFFSCLALGFTTLGKFFAVEIFHPIYEASIAHSYAKSIFYAPDVSYAGKFMKFHFLSPKINYLISSILKVSILDSVYLLTPFLLTLVSFFLITFIFKKYPDTQTPVFFIFFLPIISIRSIFENLFSRTLIFSPSYFLGFILMTFAIYFLAQNKKALFFTCATMLLLTKASFFVTLGGGVFIYYLINKDFKQMFIILGGLGSIFAPLYLLFLSGAHLHNVWIIFPAIIHYPLKFSQFFSAIIIYTILWASSILVSLKHKDSKILIICASVGMSGLLSQLLLTEIKEQNCSQFLIAAFFPLAVTFWTIIKDSIQKMNYKNQNAIYLGIGLIILSFANYYFYQPAITASKFIFSKTSPKFISANLIDAYTWLGQNITDSSVILFGKHYESSNAYWRTGFIRSAVSGKQFYCEHGANKGIFVEPDFGLRYNNCINFYKHFVTPSKISNKALTDVLVTQKNFDWTEQQAIDFIKQSKITHVILENQDKPSELLKSLTSEIYKNPDVRILEVKTKV